MLLPCNYIFIDICDICIFIFLILNTYDIYLSRKRELTLYSIHTYYLSRFINMFIDLLIGTERHPSISVINCLIYEICYSNSVFMFFVILLYLCWNHRITGLVTLTKYYYFAISIRLDVFFIIVEYVSLLPGTW